MHATLSPADAVENAKLKAELDARIAQWPRQHLFEVYGSYRRHQNNRLRRDERIIKQRLTWQQAGDLANRLQRRHQERFPNLSCWTRRYYSARRSYLIP